MLIGSVLLALAALVVIAGVVCWLAGVQLVALVKLLLAVFERFPEVRQWYRTLFDEAVRG